MSTELPLGSVLSNWRDGDDHGWATEFEWLDKNHRVQLDTLAASIQETGIQEPILLGNDGRVWDGHHPLYVALELGMTHVPVKVVASDD